MYIIMKGILCNTLPLSCKVEIQMQTLRLSEQSRPILHIAAGYMLGDITWFCM